MLLRHMKNTSWGKVADWYHDLLESGEGTYQKELILPNLTRLLGPIAGKTMLDVACGPGYFVREWHRAGANVIGVDISEELIELGKKSLGAGVNHPALPAGMGPSFPRRGKFGEASLFVGSAEDMPMIQTSSVDIATIVLAVQNIEKVHLVFAECARVLKSDGRLLMVMNHPTFRIPQASSWQWDEDQDVQYRRIDQYLSEDKVKIEMHPGKKKGESTVSFHRPLQVYVKHLAKAGLGITRLEEWISNRQGPKGKRFAASEKARKEIPLFLFFEARKFSQ